MSALMIRIGDFSRLGRVSIVALRHYDDLGLLKPARSDPQTGYRYYTVEQLPRLHRILALKELGFSLEQIAQLLHDEVPAAQLRGMFLLKRAELEQQMLEQRARLAAIETRLRSIEHGDVTPAYDVVLRPVAAQLVASLRQVVPALEAIEHLFEAVETYAGRHRVRADAPPLALYHDGEYREHEVDVEVAVPLERRPTQASESTRITVRELPGAHAMASVVHPGSYTTIDQASNALFSWITAQGYRAVGPYRELYLRFGAAGLRLAVSGAYLTEEADEYLTELQVPVELA